MIRPDAQAFDEILIFTEPRFKESEMSGSEWRISATIVFRRKGKTIRKRSCRDVETACAMLGGIFHEFIDNGDAYFASEGDICDQEGCSERMTVMYRVKNNFCRGGHKSEAPPRATRQFCDTHKARGDCGLEDADDNYEVIGTF